MRTFAVVGVVLVVILFATRGEAEEPACDDCQDLCRLVDKYLQEEKGIELWKPYASSSTGSWFRIKLAGVHDANEIENLVKGQFDEWLAQRDQSQLPCKLAPGGRGGGQAASTELETLISDPSCAILYPKTDTDKPELKKGPVQDEFEKAIHCTPLSNAVIEHERVHQQLCQQKFKEDPAHAKAILADPAVTAQNELEAWTHHKDLVGQQIRHILKTKDCGWFMSGSQVGDKNAVPTLEQTKKMSDRGWKSVNLLSGGRR